MMEYAQRRKVQAKQTEQSILQAALDLSRAHSFDNVSVREICRAAGITTGAFYHHFSSKEDLLVKGFSPLDTYMEAALASHGGEKSMDLLWVILTSYADFIQAQGWELVSRYYQHRLAQPSSSPTIDPSRYTHRVMLECLLCAHTEGLLAPGQSPDWLADFFFRHFRGIVIDWILHRGSYPLLPKLEQDYILFRQFFLAKET